MKIGRRDLASQDFAELDAGGRLAPVHPGSVLLQDFIEPMAITRYRVARNTGVPQRRIDLICRGESSVTADIALRLARLFGTSAAFWMNLQSQYDLELAEREHGDEIRSTVVPLAA